MLLLIFFIIVFLYIGIILFFNIRYPELRWNWDSINTANLKFPKGFIWGTATASHQVEGNCDNNNWYQWENSVNNQGEPCIARNQKSGIACAPYEQKETLCFALTNRMMRLLLFSGMCIGTSIERRNIIVLLHRQS